MNTKQIKTTIKDLELVGYVESFLANAEGPKFQKGEFFYMENPPNEKSDFRYWGKKYAFCRRDTGNVIIAFRTQIELMAFLYNYYLEITDKDL